MKYTIEPTAVVFDFNYDEAEIFTNKADLVSHLLNRDNYTQYFMIDHDGGYSDHFVHVSNSRPGDVKFWIPTGVQADSEDSEITLDMKRDAVMQIWGGFQSCDLTSIFAHLETVRSLGDVIQDAKACGETCHQDQHERLLARLQALV